jgi:hypothetical protein
MIKYILILCSIASSVFAQAQKGSWDSRFCPCGFSGWNNPLKPIKKDGEKLYIGGSIDSSTQSYYPEIQGRPVRGLPLMWDGKTFSVLGGGVGPIYFNSGGKGYYVQNTIVVGDSVIVIGYFDSVGDNIPAQQVAIWNKIKEVWEVPTAAPFQWGEIWVSAADDKDLFITGYFRDSLLQPAANVVRYNFQERKWYMLGSLRDTKGYQSYLRTGALNVDNFFVSGLFSSLPNDSNEYINVARWDRSQEKWYALIGGVTESLAAGNGDTVYGVFRGSGEEGWVNAWLDTAWFPITNNFKYRYPGKFLVDKGTLYLQGLKIINETTKDTLEHIAKWDGKSWEQAFAGVKHPDDHPENIPWYSMQVLDGTLYEGEKLMRANDKYFVPIDSGFCQGFSGPVNGMTLRNDTVYVVGGFSYAGGVPARGGAFWNGESWYSIGDVDKKSNNAGEFRKIIFYKDRLYALGTSLHYWQDDRWLIAGENDPDRFQGEILDFTIYRDTLIVAGRFADGETPYHVLGKWDGEHWSKFSGDALTLGQIEHNEGVFTLAAHDDDLYIGGNFVVHAGDTMNSIAHWNGERWSPIITNGERGLGHAPWGAQGYVNEIAFLDSTVLLMGNNFDSIVGKKSAGMVSVSEDGISRFLHDTNQIYYPMASKGPLTVFRDKIYLGNYVSYRGTYTPAQISSKGQVSGIGRLGKNQWEDADISCMVTDKQGRLYVGGIIGMADGKPSANFAIWTGPTASVDKDNREHSSPLISIFPVPATHAITITLQDDDVLRRVVIADAFGREITAFTTTAEMLRYDVRSLANGVYYIIVANKDMRESAKFVVCH